MLNKSIAYRLTLFISFAVISVFVMLVVTNYLLNKKSLREKIENQAINTSREVNLLVSHYTSNTKKAAHNIAEQIIEFSDNEDADILLSLTMKNNLFLNAIHVMADSSICMKNISCSIFNSDDEKLNFQENSDYLFQCSKRKELYSKFYGSADSGWTEPYRCLETGKVAVSYYTPVLNKHSEQDDACSGHVICELSLTELNNAINQMNFGERGFAFLATQDGDFITHPYPEFILTRNLLSLPSKIVDQRKVKLQKIADNLLTGSAIAFPQILDYEKSWVYYMPANENSWYLILIMPYKELFKELNRMTLYISVYVLAGIFLLFLVIFFITRKLVKPLSKVTSKLTMFNDSAGTGTDDEVKIVSNTLDYLKNWFAQYKIVTEEEEMKSIRQKQDLQQASEIQRGLIKTDFPAFPDRNDIDLYALYKPSGIISGDLFDYFFIDDNNLVFTIGDVSGKGVPSAIFMGVAQTIIKNKAVLKRADVIVESANIELCTTNYHQFFLTLFLGVLNMKTGVLTYCNAAHDFPFIVKSDGTVTEINKTHGLPLGLFPERGYKTSEIKLRRGDTIVLYTDGVTELLNSENEEFSYNRLRSYLGRLSGMSPEELIKNIDARLDKYKNGVQQSDDISLLAIKYY